GWYNYTGGGNPPQAILTIPGRVIVLKTAQGNYAKMEVLSYYQGNPDTSSEEFINFATRSQGKHYTFRYAVQPNGSRKF
ncbi:MAG: HmuY family protein, partial [Tunicatimonas sp.]|uniref:HmuY family protein n=1 Tax=Tunicatimonas sp. TaxID=1940096 RepID=UPI003C756E4A